MQRLVPPLLGAAQDLDLRVKYAAERALRHLLATPSAVEAFAAGAEAAGNASLVKALRDCARTTLSTMSATSDDENDKT